MSPKKKPLYELCVSIMTTTNKLMLIAVIYALVFLAMYWSYPQ
jgi:hypothetical protein